MRIGGVSVGKVKELGLPEEPGPRTATRPGRRSRSIPVRPDLLGRPGDPAPEDAARRDLRRADPRQPGGARRRPRRGGGGVRPTDVGELSGAPPTRSRRAATSSSRRSRIRSRSTRSSRASTTRPAAAFQVWMQNAAIAVDGRGLDLNDSFGNLGPFATDASDVLRTLRQPGAGAARGRALTGDVFEALTEHDQALAGAIVGSNRTFARPRVARATPSPRRSRSSRPSRTRSRLTLDRLEDLRRRRRAAVRRPDAGRPRPRRPCATSRSLAPNARRLFRNLGPLIKASATGLPALRSFLARAAPVMDGLDPFLANFNPLLRYAGLPGAGRHRLPLQPVVTTADFLPVPPGRASRATLAADHDLHPGDALDPPAAPQDQPRQRLPAAVRDRQPLLHHAGRDLPEPRLRQHLRRPAGDAQPAAF